MLFLFVYFRVTYNKYGCSNALREAGLPVVKSLLLLQNKEWAHRICFLNLYLCRWTNPLEAPLSVRRPRCRFRQKQSWLSECGKGWAGPALSNRTETAAAWASPRFSPGTPNTRIAVQVPSSAVQIPGSTVQIPRSTAQIPSKAVQILRGAVQIPRSVI